MTTTIQASPYRGRFAPSPTGPLHLGSLVAALGSWLQSRHHSGAWLVRIEDVDRPRERRGSAVGQLRALAALGLLPDGEVVRQSTRSVLYLRALEDLADRGLAFQCRCTRSDLAASGGVHRACTAQPSGDAPAWRLRVPDTHIGFEDSVRGHVSQDLGAEVGDFVLRRADGCWSYHLAVVVDDADQRITEIVRGADLIDSTARQIYLQEMLGVDTPRYAHLPLIRQADGRKLGKSVHSAPFDLEHPVATLALAYRWLGQDSTAISGATDPGDALRRALAAYEPARLPAADLFLPAT